MGVGHTLLRQPPGLADGASAQGRSDLLWAVQRMNLDAALAQVGHGVGELGVLLDEAEHGADHT